MDCRSIWVSRLLLAVLCVFISQSLVAMPNFARKYNMGCNSCHNPVPRLNEFGYKFRAAGFRIPDQIGQDVSTNKLSDYYAARNQMRLDYKTTDLGTSAPNPTPIKQMSFFEFTFYPISGAFDKNFSSLMEISFVPEEAAEFENAYVRYTAGSEGRFFTLRGGIFHPFEGYGASDRPIGISRPLFQTTKATGTLFKPWGYDQAGLEAGYTVDRTAFRVTVFNGITSGGEPAQYLDPAGANAFAKARTDPSYNNKDVQLFVNHILTDNGGGISGYAYWGTVDLPASAAKAADSYQRYAIYASYPIQRAQLLAGFQQGSDNPSGGSNFNSHGFFGEANYSFSEPFWMGLRFDSFDPSTAIDSNELQAVSLFANYSLDNGLQFIAEYQNVSAKKSSSVTQTDNSFQLRAFLIF